jgi:hypothetical protein
VKGSGSGDTLPEQVVVDEDQTLGFSGASANVLRARYRELVAVFRSRAGTDPTIADVGPELPNPGVSANDVAA